MKRVLCLIGLLWCNYTLAEADPAQAHKIVADTITQTLQVINESRPVYQSQPELFLKRVDGVLSPVLDFDRIARRVMAKHYRTASDAERSRFISVFKQSLLNTYARGLVEFTDYKINMLPLRTLNQSDKNTKVDFEVVTAAGQIFPITQSLYFNTQQNTWLIQNVIINGINVGQLFRDQFARLVDEKGSVSAAIDAWEGVLKAGIDTKEAGHDSADETE